MKRSLRLILLLAACMLLVVSVGPALAQVAPKITVAPTWSPILQLTSQDANGAAYPNWDPNDDYRYVDARLNVTTSVEFWAVELSCSVNANVFDRYEPNGGNEDWGDDQPVLSWGGDWNGPDGWVEIPPTFSEAAGLLKVTAAASKQGRNTPFGRNGVNTTVNLGTLRFRVQPQPPTFTGATSPLNCTFSFLDRNGKVVIAPTYTAPTPISIIGGYTVTGVVTYQGRTVKNGIGVDCHVWQGNPEPYMPPGSPTVTNTSGAFTFSNIRQFGWMECLAFGNISDPAAGRQPDVYLTAREGFDLNDRGSYRFLPLELKAGNVDRNDCDPNPDWENQCINNEDIVKLTNNWSPAPLPADPDGDVNGDGRTDKADLAIMAGNMNNGEDVQGDHLLYSLTRAWTTNGRDSRIWRGDRSSGAVTQQVPNAAGTADFWGTLSPDGSTVVFVRKSKTGTAIRYELFKAPAAGGAATVLLSKANAGNMDAFAPSWSQDGTRIAFVCSTGYGQEWDKYSGYGFNAGDLCMVDATGRNFRQLTNGLIAKIFPPAWEGEWLIFGGTERAGWMNCQESLCVLELGNMNLWRLDEHIPDVSVGAAEMPLMIGGRLFYRYKEDATGNSYLRMIDGINYESCNPGPCDFVKPYTAHPATTCPSPTNARPARVHTNVVYDADYDDDGIDDGVCDYQTLDVNFDTNAPFVVDYFEVSPYGWELIFYGDQFASDWFYHSSYRWDRNLEDNHYNNASDHGPCADSIPDEEDLDSDLCWPEWNPNTWDRSDSHRVDTYITNDWWNGDENNGSLLHAERATVDWNP